MSGISNAKIDIGAIRAIAQKALQGGDINLRFALNEINAMCSDLDKDLSEIVREKEMDEQLVFERGMAAGIRHGRSQA